MSQERIMTLKKQSSQITLQAQQEREHFHREKNNLIIMLQKVRTLLITMIKYMHSLNLLEGLILMSAGERETGVFGREVCRAVGGAGLH